MSTVFSGPAGVQTYRAIAIKQGLKMYALHRMQPNRAWTPSNMLRAAGQITGHTYKRGRYGQAIADLEAWLLVNGTNGGENV